MSDEKKIMKAASAITHAILALYDLGDLHFPRIHPLVYGLLCEILHVRILEELADGPEGTAPALPIDIGDDDPTWCP